MTSFNIGDLKIPVPIIQGGMGIGISLSGLASAVANMGGVGVISSVGIGLINNPAGKNYRASNIDAIRAEIRKAKELTKGVLGVNIMSVISNFSDMVKTSIEEGIDIIFSGAGLPLDLPKYLTAGARTRLVPIVSSSRAASIICQKWQQNFNRLPDAFVVEGPKAGGHLGFKSDKLEDPANKLEDLVEGIVNLARAMKEKFNKDIPVIAAGGIFSGSDIFQIMKRGASAVQLGTRFVATEECDADVEFKNAFVNAKEKDIKILNSPVGMPGRMIYNKFLEETSQGKRKPVICKNHCMKSCNPKTTSYCISEALLQACRGNLSDGFAFAGANAGRIEKISTVPALIDELSSGYDAAEMEYESFGISERRLIQALIQTQANPVYNLALSPI